MSELTGTIPAPASPVPFRTATPAAASPRTWLRHIVGGGQIVETCPEFCASSHLGDERGMLTDLVHSGSEVSTQVEVFDQWSAGVPVTASAPFLAARVQVDPYSDDPRRNVPHVALEPWQDEIMEGLTPDGLAAVIAQIRAHCDRLEQVHAQLVQARAEHGAGAI